MLNKTTIILNLQANWVPRRENNNPKKIDLKDGSSKMAGDWSSRSDKDKKPLSSQPKLDSTKFRNIGKVHYHAVV